MKQLITTIVIFVSTCFVFVSGFIFGILYGAYQGIVFEKIEEEGESDG